MSRFILNLVRYFKTLFSSVFSLRTRPIARKFTQFIYKHALTSNTKSSHYRKTSSLVKSFVLAFSLTALESLSP